MTNFNNRTRIVAIALTIITLFSMAPVSVFAENTHDGVNAPEQVLKEDRELAKDAEPISEKTGLTIADELPELICLDEIEKNNHVKRLAEAEEDLNTVVFKNADGTNTSYIFSEPVKYADDNGVIRDKKK